MTVPKLCVYQHRPAGLKRKVIIKTQPRVAEEIYIIFFFVSADEKDDDDNPITVVNPMCWVLLKK